MDLKNLFEVELNNKIESSSEILSNSDACFEINIDNYSCHLDLKSARRIIAGKANSADCCISMNSEVFQKLLDGKLNIPLALATRKIKVSGNLALFAKLRELFKS